MTLRRLYDRALIRLHNLYEDLSADPLDDPLRFDESEAPLAPRSPLSLDKEGKPRWFELRGEPTRRQIRENDLPRY
jgi:hypothetical protein